MDIQKAYNFFFHPFAPSHTSKETALSCITVTALTVLTGGIYALLFATCNLLDRCIKKTPPPHPTKTIHAVASQTLTSKKIQNLKRQHKKQLADFEKWAANNDWGTFHSSHYDWWMFPIQRTSAGYGDTYAFSKEELASLEKDPLFIKDFRRGVELELLAWGWDSTKDQPVTHPGKQQKWTDYGVRLGKMADSLKLLNQMDLYQKVQLFAQVNVNKALTESWVLTALGLPHS